MTDTANKPWTIGRCYEWTKDYFERLEVPQPRISTEWLLQHATGLKRIELYTNYKLPLEPSELAIMHEDIKRRAKGEPLQYIIGETSFRQLDIWCEPGVLIPRPETELLVDYVLNYLDRSVTGWEKPVRERTVLPWNAEVEAARQAEETARAATAEEAAASGEEPDAPLTGDAVHGDAAGDDTTADGVLAAGARMGGEPAAGELAASAPVAEASPSPVRPARVLEIGCGTGCISLSIASERPECVTCVATDISEAAVDLARRNRARAGVSDTAVDIRLGDLAEPVHDEERSSFDVLVSNPPYIPSAVMEALPREVRDHEPHLALDGGADGLAIFRRLVSAAPYVLKPNGLLACELFEDSLEDAARICENAGLHDIEILKDLTGRSRFIFAHTG